MNPAIPIAVSAALEVWVGTLLPPWIGWFPLWAGATTGWAAFAYLVNVPELLGKRHAPLLAEIVLAPTLQFARGVARLARRMGVSERQEIVPGLWVGGWPSRGPSPLAHLDVTAELRLRASPAAYRAIPMLDGAAPRLAAWEAGVEQALEWRRAGRDVLVHCAYGHGRSVSVVIGVLIAEGWDPDVDSALRRVQAIRPRARLTGPQRRLVDRGVAAWRASHVVPTRP